MPEPINLDKVEKVMFELCRDNPAYSIAIRIYDPKTFKIEYQSTMSLTRFENG